MIVVFLGSVRMLEKDKHELDMQKRFKEIEEEKALYSVSLALCILWCDESYPTKSLGIRSHLTDLLSASMAKFM